MLILFELKMSTFSYKKKTFSFNSAKFRKFRTDSFFFGRDKYRLKKFETFPNFYYLANTFEKKSFDPKQFLPDKTNNLKPNRTWIKSQPKSPQNVSKKKDKNIKMKKQSHGLHVCL
jgi:hypothetical protein